MISRELLRANRLEYKVLTDEISMKDNDSECQLITIKYVQD